MPVIEANFDGLVGPTHHYGGLSFGNVASMQHRHEVANPKEAALQGLEKMWALAKMGAVQGVLPPHQRPYLPILRALGFSGSNAEVIARASKEAKPLFCAVCSASSMWAANAATVSLSDQLHITPANLVSMFHRSFEAPATSRILKAIFRNAHHHDPLPATGTLSDEGAANHMRFTGGEIFVYGRKGFEKGPEPKLYPARQTLEASQALARRHQVKAPYFVQQHPDAIDAGVFHNDVAAVAFEELLFFHEKAYLEKDRFLESLPSLTLLEVKESEIPLKKAVETYLFNSQIIRTKEGKRVLISPSECQHDPLLKGYIATLPFDEVFYFDLRQSMHNGGGPACLRLSVPLSETALKGVNPACLLDEALYLRLKSWIEKHYRDRLHLDDLADIKLHNESTQALEELSRLLDLKGIYDF